MTTPRTRHGTDVKFPFVFEKNGRTGRIKKWGDQKFGTYFGFAGQPERNSFATFKAAYEYIDRD